MKTKTHPAILILVAISLSVFLTFLLIEIILQVLPVQSYMKLQSVTPETPIVRLKPNTTYTHSAGWDFDAHNRGRVNTQGFVSDYDYDAQNDRPLIAVIGDSYVESKMVAFDKTFHGRLNEYLDSRVRVYNFAIGGAPLSQYLAYAVHTRDTYKPDYMIVNIVSNDFDESLPAYKNKPRFHYFVPDESGDLKPQLIGTYKPSFLKDLIARSAIVRYVYFHLSFANTYNRFLFSFRDNSQSAKVPVESKLVPKTDKRFEDSKKAVDAFLDLLPRYSGLPKSKILLIVDGDRNNIYQDRPAKGYFKKMRDYLLKQSKVRGYEIIDMQPSFAAHYAENQKKFNFEKDYHWNALAHGVVYNEILKSENLADILN